VTRQAPIVEHDPTRKAVIEPTDLFDPVDVPANAVITWMRDVVDGLAAEGRLRERHRFVAESAVHPVWEVDWEGGPLVVVLAPVGAPVAAALFEMLIALGCRRFVAVGSAGGLTADLEPGTVVVPEGSVRDEGVSYHYAAPARLARAHPGMQARLRSTLVDHGIPVTGGLTWTTDAIFRETRDKVVSRVAEGCVAVEMEAASLAAVAAFRRVELGHAVYIADTLHGEEWDGTHLVRPDTAFRRRLFAAAAACLAEP
jgi:uridine phosphorylase